MNAFYLYRRILSSALYCREPSPLRASLATSAKFIRHRNPRERPISTPLDNCPLTLLQRTPRGTDMAIETPLLLLSAIGAPVALITNFFVKLLALKETQQNTILCSRRYYAHDCRNSRHRILCSYREYVSVRAKGMLIRMLPNTPDRLDDETGGPHGKS